MVDIWCSPKPISRTERHVNHERITNDQEFDGIYTRGCVLGKGSFGTVRQATSCKSGETFAVKTIIREKAGSAIERLIEREILILKRVNHPHVIRLEEVYESSKQTFLVIELCSRGSLETLLKLVHSFAEKAAVSVMQQLVDAVAYLHDNDIVHRDLKLENILLCEPRQEGVDLNIKLTDFGLSYICDGVGSDFMMQQMCGTPTYMAPEVITNFGYSKQCDIWSVGVIMYTLLTGVAPFIAASEDKLFDLIKFGSFNQSCDEWRRISPAGQQLIKGMLEVDPAHRYTSKEVLHNHPWLQGELTANGVTTNVLRMMAEYDKEQKKQDTGNQMSDTGEVNIPAKSSRTKSPGTQHQSPAVSREITQSSSTTLTTDQNSNTAKSGTLPGYMQPTKSSLASMNTRSSNGK